MNNILLIHNPFQQAPTTMNQAQAAAQHPRTPPLGNTGQYTISVSKPGTGEDPEQLEKRLRLTVVFTTSEEPVLFIPDACRVDIRRNGIPEGTDQYVAFDHQNGSYIANVVMTLQEEWQATWWIDVYLLKGDWEKYAVSAYLSTLLVDDMTVSCTYHPHPQPNRQDG
ncbi:MAG: hypothetical protein ICV83_04075 [Cytophagales bacterium]|nr:hypothetical protein [Cytophagales bacterium]